MSRTLDSMEAERLLEITAYWSFWDGQVPETVPRSVALPKRLREVEAARATIAREIEEAGPLDPRACELIRLGIAVGAGFGTAARSHAHRARVAGATDAEVEQAVFLGVNMIGLPKTMMAWQAVRED